MRAGVGRADITPPVGIPAGGWGNQYHEISEGNDLELWATVLVVEDADGARAALADIDLCILDAPEPADYDTTKTNPVTGQRRDPVGQGAGPNAIRFARPRGIRSGRPQAWRTT